MYLHWPNCVCEYIHSSMVHIDPFHFHWLSRKSSTLLAWCWTAPPATKMINKTYKLLLGIFLLIVVDIIWVSSSELTKVRRWQCSMFDVQQQMKTNRCLYWPWFWLQMFYLFCVVCLQFLYQNENFDKPFFCTYFKTSMFTLYLLVLGLIAPWKNSCDPNRNNYTVSFVRFDFIELNLSLISLFLRWFHFLFNSLLIKM